MNGAPEIERHALARAFQLSAPLRGALLALRRAWGASAPRDRAQARHSRGNASPLARGLAFPLTHQNEQGGKCPCKKKEDVKE